MEGLKEDKSAGRGKSILLKSEDIKNTNIIIIVIVEVNEYTNTLTKRNYINNAKAILRGVIY